MLTLTLVSALVSTSASASGNNVKLLDAVGVALDGCCVVLRRVTRKKGEGKKVGAGSRCRLWLCTRANKVF